MLNLILSKISCQILFFLHFFSVFTLTNKNETSYTITVNNTRSSSFNKLQPNRKRQKLRQNITLEKQNGNLTPKKSKMGRKENEKKNSIFTI